MSRSVPLSSTPYASASLTGLVNPNSQIVENTIVNPPISQRQSFIAQPTTLVTPVLSPRPAVVAPQLTVPFTVRPTTPIYIAPNPVVVATDNRFPPTASLIPQPPTTTAALGLAPVPGVPPPVPDVASSSYGDLVTEQSVSDELRRYGYEPMAQIIVQDKSIATAPRLKYVKAINRLGQYVFIAIDTSGYMSVRTRDLTLIKETTGSLVPFSVKNGSLGCVGNDCGVALECDSSDLCVLTRDSQDMTVREVGLTLVEKQPETAAVVRDGNSVISYPVVKLSDIRANPEQVLINSDIATARLRNLAYEALTEKRVDEWNAVAELVRVFKDFMDEEDSFRVNLENDLRLLRELNDTYLAIPSMSEAHRAKFDIVRNNLSRRNLWFSDLLIANEKVVALAPEINRMITVIKEQTVFIQDKNSHSGLPVK